MRVTIALVLALGCSSTSESSAPGAGDAASSDVSSEGGPIEPGATPGGAWDVYAFEVDGTPLMLGGFDGVVPGVDFAADCTFDKSRVHFTLLAPTHFYSDAMMTMMPCTVPAATEFPDHLRREISRRRV